MIDNLEAMLAAGQDNALLRYTLGTQYIKNGETQRAVDHLREAVSLDPAYSAAWKAYGKALAALPDPAGACDAYTKGIEAATKKGDIQAAREMQVFLKRIQKQLAGQSR
ncbi:MAG: tetratricopeptide repeat protein [Gammaproteobacteria bacterium]